jgi:hypothetical protein
MSSARSRWRSAIGSSLSISNRERIAARVPHRGRVKRPYFVDFQRACGVVCAFRISRDNAQPAKQDEALQHWR